MREGALACAACGSDDRAGWAEEAPSEGLDLPEPMTDEEYEDAVAAGFGEDGPARPSVPLRTRLIGLLLALFFLAGAALLLW